VKPPYEFIAHTADVAIRAYGDTLAGAFEAAGMALTDLMTEGNAGEGGEELPFAVESIDLEGLLVAFLSELIYRFDADRRVMTGLRVTLESDQRLDVVATAEEFDEDRHGEGTPAKGVSYHMIEIVQGRNKDACHVQVLIDI